MSGSDFRPFGVVIGFSAVLGLVVGFLWAALAPRVLAVPGTEPLAPASPLDPAFAAADLQFGAIGFGVGVAVGATALLTRAFRRARYGALLGVIVGGIAGSALAARVGSIVTRSSETWLPVTLNMKGVLLAWSLGGALIGLAAGLRLRRRDGGSATSGRLD